MGPTIKERLNDLANDAPKGIEVPSVLAPRARRRIARNVAGTVCAVGVAVALAFAGVHSLNRSAPQPAHTPPPDIFAGVHGWITYGGPLIEAVNPDDPSATVIVDPGPAGTSAYPLEWSSDGSKLLIQREDHLYVESTDGTEQRVATGYWGSFSPDGREVVYSNNDGSLYVIGVGGGSPRVLAAGGGNGDWLYGPSWSPDGSQIAFSWRSQGQPNWGVSSIAPDGSGQKLLVDLSDLPPVISPDRGEESGGLTWAPDGSHLALFIAQDKYHAQIWVVGADGSGLRKITDTPGGHAWPTWSPDGSRIAFVRHSGGLFTMAADGSDVRKISDIQDDFVIAWNPVR